VLATGQAPWRRPAHSCRWRIWSTVWPTCPSWRMSSGSPRECRVQHQQPLSHATRIWSRKARKFLTFLVNQILRHIMISSRNPADSANNEEEKTYPSVSLKFLRQHSVLSTRPIGMHHRPPSLWGTAFVCGTKSSGIPRQRRSTFTMTPATLVTPPLLLQTEKIFFLFFLFAGGD
jgi:hypothetical protein